jgi:6-phosphogluconolactonase (cycloisomerase 2 family)
VAPTAVFSPDGRFLVVTDSGADRITTFAVGRDGRLGDPISTPSVGAGPFGAAFHGGALLVAETEAALPGATSVTSYRLRPDGYVQPISSAIRSGETAGCWLAAREASPLVFVADTGAGTISSFVQGYDGVIRLLTGVAIPVVAGSAPVDLGLSRDGHYLYQLFDGLGAVGVYKIAANGALSALGSSGGFSTAGAQGIAVY